MAEKILIIDDDLDTLRLVGMMLQRQGYEISVATNGKQGLAKAAEENPDLILLDIMMPEMDGYEVARALRGHESTAKVPILMFTAKSQLDDKVAGFEVGADDYLTKPTHPSELQAHVKALLARTVKGKQSAQTMPLEQQAHIIGVLSARGGLGASTLAVNLGVALLNRTRTDVIVAELVPGQGSMAFELGAPNPHVLTELLTGQPGELSREKVKDRLFAHPSGLRLLVASERPRDMELMISATHFEVLVDRLASLCRYLILDLGGGLPKYVQTLLGLCHDRIVVMDASPINIAYTRALLNDMVELGIDQKRVGVVVNNRVRSELSVPWAQIQEKLGHSVLQTFTPAPELFYQAVRKETPAVTDQPTSLTGQQYDKLAAMLQEREAPVR